MAVEPTARELEQEVAAAGLTLSAADLVRILPMWQDNAPRRAWLRSADFSAEEARGAEAELGPPPEGRPAQMPPTGATPSSPKDDGSDTTGWTLAEAAGALSARAISATELVQAYLERTRRHDPILHTASCVLEDAALAAAKASDARRAAGAPLSPIDGIPLGIKDCIPVAGAPFEGGSKAFAGNVASEDGPPVAAFRRAGAIILAKQRMHELGAGPAVPDGPAATGRNPYDIERIPGGSSSGSAAAVAAGFCAGALGSDAAGSVRIPAAFCGLVGLKPTFGLLSTAGCLPLTRSLDTLGTLTRDVDGAALLLAHASEAAHLAPLRRSDALRGTSVRGVRIGLLRRYYWDTSDIGDDERRACEAALAVFRDLGAEMVTVDMPSIDRNDVAYTTLLAESFELHGRPALLDPSPLTDWLRTQVLTAALFTSDDVHRARMLQRRIRTEALAALRDVDVLLHPGMAGPPGPFSTMFISALTQPRSRFTRPWNVTGLPALALPCGQSQDGMPLSIQLAGRPYAEPELLAVASAFEAATPWHRIRPDPARWTG